MKQICLITVILLACFARRIDAQTVPILNSFKNDTVKKTILDYARYRIFYTYRYIRDPRYSKAKRRATTFLQIGDRYNRFTDYNDFRSTEINDSNVKAKSPLMSYVPAMMKVQKLVRFNYNIVIDKTTQKITYQHAFGIGPTYQYEEDEPEMKWELIAGDSTIVGYPCKKARTTFRGRTYTAWYSPDVSLPYGPFTFHGLPGLIFTIADADDEYSFKISGIETVNFRDPIYLGSEQGMLRTSREEARRAYHNYCLNPGKAMFNSGKVKMSEEEAADIQPHPYNPIEKE